MSIPIWEKERKCYLKHVRTAGLILTPENGANVKIRRMNMKKKTIGYITTITGFLFALTAAGASDIESMSGTAIVIVSILGLALMIAGDRLIHSKRKPLIRKVNVDGLSDRQSVS